MSTAVCLWPDGTVFLYQIPNYLNVYSFAIRDTAIGFKLDNGDLVPLDDPALCLAEKIDLWAIGLLMPGQLNLRAFVPIGMSPEEGWARIMEKLLEGLPTDTPKGRKYAKD